MDLLASRKEKEGWLVKCSNKVLNLEVHSWMLGGVVLTKTPFHLKFKWGRKGGGAYRGQSGIKRHSPFAKSNYYITNKIKKILE